MRSLVDSSLELFSLAMLHHRSQPLPETISCSERRELRQQAILSFGVEERDDLAIATLYYCLFHMTTLSSLDSSTRAFIEQARSSLVEDDTGKQRRDYYDTVHCVNVLAIALRVTEDYGNLGSCNIRTIRACCDLFSSRGLSLRAWLTRNDPTIFFLLHNQRKSVLRYLEQRALASSVKAPLTRD